MTDKKFSELNTSGSLGPTDRVPLLQGGSTVTISGSNLKTSITGSWTPYTVYVTTGSGSFTSATATGSYLIQGPITHVIAIITITTVGTAGGMRFSLPTSPMNTPIFVGRENVGTGKLMQGMTSGSTVVCYDATGTNVQGSGYIFYMNGSYRNT